MFGMCSSVAEGPHRETVQLLGWLKEKDARDPRSMSIWFHFERRDGKRLDSS